MKIILTIVLTALVTTTTLFVVNHFTLFGYYLPHKPQIVYMLPNDISAHFTPSFMIVGEEIAGEVNE